MNAITADEMTLEAVLKAMDETLTDYATEYADDGLGEDDDEQQEEKQDNALRAALQVLDKMPLRPFPQLWRETADDQDEETPAMRKAAQRLHASIAALPTTPSDDDEQTARDYRRTFALIMDDALPV